ncbi:MAG: helix-turn-helix domain-containing protein [Bryobacteraceae bacterium]|jgi:transcriptional regulator with XRE-family HTH domain
MSSHNRENVAQDLGPTIRVIRKAHGMTTGEFAAALRVDQSMVSRYESGKRVPRAPVLLRLLRLAKGVEKNPILEQLSIVRGRPVEEHDALREAAAMISESEALSRELKILADARPNLARFAYLAPTILHAQKEIDASLNTILKLWLSTPDFPEKVQCFRDSARFLEIAIGRAVLDSPGEKQKYKVLLPVDFGDGVRHRTGEIVDLTVTAAKHYSHALRSIEDEAVADTGKKSA